jgi:hypothetical protein
VHTRPRVCPKQKGKTMHLGTSGCRKVLATSARMHVGEFKRKQARVTLITKEHTHAHARSHACTHACTRTLRPCSNSARTHLSMGHPNTHAREATRAHTTTHTHMYALPTAQTMHRGTSGCHKAPATSPRMCVVVYKRQQARLTRSPTKDNHANTRSHACTRMQAHPPTMQQQCSYTP